jgi:hypothetical protein
MKSIKLIILATLLIVTSCQKDLETEFKDPTKVDPPTNKLVAGMWTGLTYKWKLYVRDYGEYWWQNWGLGIGAYCQINRRWVTTTLYNAYFVDYNNLSSGNGFDPSGLNGTGGDAWGDYYTRMKEWALIRDNVATLTGDDLKDNQIYLPLATIYKDFWALRMVDFFNKMPYFDAFKGTQGVFFPKYDDPKEIYISVLNDFKEISANLQTMYNGMSTIAKNNFKDQDIALGGDITKWIQYTNFLRLKYAVKLAGVDAATATPHITEALANLPTTDFTFSTHTSDAPNGGGTWVRGMYERYNSHFIPNLLIKRMNFGTDIYEPGIDDPRLPVMALPTKYGDYRGISMNADADNVPYRVTIDVEKKSAWYTGYDNPTNSLSTNIKSIYNPATYCWNYTNFPAIMMTLAELDLLKAEVVARGYGTTGKTAGQHIQDAVVNSCNFWYTVSAGNVSWNASLVPLHPVKSAADITTYAAKVKTLYDAQANLEDRIEIIMQQLFIHVNITNQYELWGELRRTRHPLLEPFTLLGSTSKPMPERLRYPSSELQTNQIEYLKVKDQDNFTTPIFWVPDSKKTVVPYLNSAL